jgi:hypothetical protein
MRKKYKCLNPDCEYVDIYDVIPRDELPYRFGPPLRCKQCDGLHLLEMK